MHATEATRRGWICELEGAPTPGLAGGLYGQLATKQGNVVLSPYSVAVALGMTLPGAAGRTATEMRQVLGVRNDDRFHGGLNALSAYVEGLAGTQHRADGSGAELALEGASQLYGQEGLAWARAVDEDGTEAAAATAVVISTTSSAPVTEPFHVDRPFLFVIHDVKHGTPLFLGRVDDPSE